MNVHFQPIVDIESDAVVRAEALCRLDVELDGLEGTAEYIAHAEQHGFMRELTDSVFELAFHDLEGLPHEMAPAVSINISKSNLDEPDFCDRVAALLKRYGIPGSCLTVELPEGIEFLDDGRSLDTLHRLAGSGVRISVDGFGPTLSMFTYIELARLNVHEVKIDARLLSTMGPSRRSALRNILELCRSCRVDAVIKNVETADQLELAKELGCNRAQGNLIALPMDSSDFHAWLEGHTVLAADWRAPAPAAPRAPAPPRSSLLERFLPFRHQPAPLAE